MLSILPKIPVRKQMDRTVAPSIALLYPADKYNNQTRGDLDRNCATGMYPSNGHVEFPKLQTK